MDKKEETLTIYKDDEPKSEYPHNRKDPKPGHNPDGTWKKGFAPNPGGKPSDKKFKALLKELFGEDGKELLYILIAQMYGVDLQNTGLDKNIKKILPELEKKSWRQKLDMIDKRLQSDNAKWLIDRMFGKAIQNISAEIDSKVTNVTVDLPENIKPEDF